MTLDHAAIRAWTLANASARAAYRHQPIASCLGLWTDGEKVRQCMGWRVVGEMCRKCRARRVQR